MEARRIDKNATSQVRRTAVRQADAEHLPLIADPAAQHGAPKGDHGAVVLGIALVAQHHGMAVEDSGRGRAQGRDAAEIGLEAPRLATTYDLQIRDAIAAPVFVETPEHGTFVLFACDDQFANPLMAEPACGAVGVQRLFAGDAEPCLEAVPRVIDAGVDDFAVA